MDKEIFVERRKSYIDMGEIFLWTATINKWQRLLLKDNYKNVIINSLRYLSDAGKIDVFAFVIMPNHIHLIWRINEMNGKETSQGSFLKYTAHEFKKNAENG
jgi:REP element-mobilizing transposase RayT